MALALVAGGMALPVLAAAPDTSPRPLPRPAAIAAFGGLPVAVASAPEAAPAPVTEPEPVAMLAAAAPLAMPEPQGYTLRPRPRPAMAQTDQTARTVARAMPPAVQEAAVAPRGLFGLFRRKESPGDQPVKAAAIRPNPSQDAIISRKGAVCGDPSIRGEVLAPIPARIKGCGIAEPVRVTSVGGVALSSAATMDCTTATALKTWVDRGLQPAFKGKVQELQVAAHYVCRSRNNRPGAPVSEHGRGKAIDISGFTLTGGKEVSILGDWRKRDGKAIKKAHKAACGIFGTTLGPGSDGFHEDHLHFDTASHRNGAYCR